MHKLLCRVRVQEERPFPPGCNNGTLLTSHYYFRIMASHINALPIITEAIAAEPRLNPLSIRVVSNFVNYEVNFPLFAKTVRPNGK